jgi:ABC transport system ATP-binding/permease protein
VSHDRDFLDRVVTSVIAAEGEGKWLEYPGGYSDMLNQRSGTDLSRTDNVNVGSGPQARTMVPTAPPVATVPEPVALAPGGKRKLTFKDKHALATLPKTIEALQGQIARHQAELADGTLYNRNPKRFADVSLMLGSAQEKLAQAENDWLELELAQ